MFSSAAISWGSKRQVSIALSSCEAEIMASSEASKEAIYLKRFATEMGIHDESPIELHGDNKGAIDLATIRSITRAQSTSTDDISTCVKWLRMVRSWYPVYRRMTI